MEANNTKTMREALELCVQDMCRYCRAEARACNLPQCLDGCETLKIAKAALAAPLRNGEIGTAEEQDARFVKWRYSNPLRAELGLDALAWAQMPYEADTKKEGAQR